MEGWIVSSAMVGCIGSVLCAGWLSDSWGRKPALVLTGVLFLVSLIGSMLAIAPGDASGDAVDRRTRHRLLLGGRSHVHRQDFTQRSRGRMVSFYQLAITVGILLAFFSNASSSCI